MSHARMPDLDFLLSRYFIDASSGDMFFKSGGFGVREGQRCGSDRPDGYRRVKIMGRLYLQHRVVFFMSSGVDPLDLEVDHIDGVRSNNSPSNLRLCDRPHNLVNTPKYRNNTSGFKGVNFHKASGKFAASLSVGGKRKHLGLFVSAIEAAKEYNMHAFAVYGEFAKLNKIGE